MRKRVYKRCDLIISWNRRWTYWKSYLFCRWNMHHNLWFIIEFSTKFHFEYYFVYVASLLSLNFKTVLGRQIQFDPSKFDKLRKCYDLYDFYQIKFLYYETHNFSTFQLINYTDFVTNKSLLKLQTKHHKLKIFEPKIGKSFAKFRIVSPIGVFKMYHGITD